MAARGQYSYAHRCQENEARIAAYQKLSPAEQLASVEKQNEGHPEWRAKKQRAKIARLKGKG